MMILPPILQNLALYCLWLLHACKVHEPINQSNDMPSSPISGNILLVHIQTLDLRYKTHKKNLSWDITNIPRIWNCCYLAIALDCETNAIPIKTWSLVYTPNLHIWWRSFAWPSGLATLTHLIHSLTHSFTRCSVAHLATLMPAYVLKGLSGS